MAALIVAPRFENAWLTLVKGFTGVIGLLAVGAGFATGCQRSGTVRLGVTAGGWLGAGFAAGEPPPKTNVATFEAAFVTVLATCWTVAWTVLRKAANPSATRAEKDELGVGVVGALGLRYGLLAGWT